MATIFKLIIEDDEGKTTVYPLTDGSVSIGRREGNTIRLMERNVSRRHARLLKNNGAVFIEDLDSYNGIRINGERIAGRYEVKEGDLLEIGDYHLALQQSEVADARPAGAQRDGWPRPGTLPDIQLPNEMVEGGGSNRATLIDQPVPSMVPGAIAKTVERGALDQPLPPSQPLVKPPPRGETGGGPGSLPPFPGPGGLAPPKSPMYGESSQATEASPSTAAASKLAVGPAYVSSVPRVVCVSSSYAGKEFALTRPELIIGRVEDNDIVIEHRSVSRNHAKILFDGRTHKIIDLQSANGILVNGEEYAMTDLRKGDLIELGHVRFRFIPADEAFIATEEEGREMREAGVEPPEAPKPSPTNGDLNAGLVAPAAPAAVETPLPAYDPSTAATVTDTPLDALGMGDLAAPRIEATPVASQAPTDKPMRATANERPMEIRNVPSTGRPSAAAYSATVPDAPAPLSEPPPRAQTRTDSEVQAPAEGPKKGLLLVIGALLLTAVVLAFMVLTGGGSAERQAALQKAFAVEDWERVVELYEEDPSDFEDPKAVLPLYRKALSSQSQRAPEPPPAAAPPTSAVEMPIGDGEPDPEPLEPVEDPAPEPDGVELPAGDADAKEAASKRTRRRRAPRPKPKASASGAAAKLATDGSRALMQGDLTTAEKLLKRCLKADPSLASCHRTLGVLYAQKDDPQRSIQHYRKYVQLRPKAADANRVREMIRTAEQAVSGAGGENSL